MKVKQLLPGVLWGAFCSASRRPRPPTKTSSRPRSSTPCRSRSTLPVPFDGDRKGSGLGAGFVVDADRGWIMTNAHVVGRSPSRVEVALSRRGVRRGHQGLRRPVPRPRDRAASSDRVRHERHRGADARVRRRAAGRPPGRRVRASVAAAVHRHARHHLRRHRPLPHRAAADRRPHQPGQLRRAADQPRERAHRRHQHRRHPRRAEHQFRGGDQVRLPHTGAAAAGQGPVAARSQARLFPRRRQPQGAAGRAQLCGRRHAASSCRAT